MTTPAPDFIVVGARVNGLAMLWASKSLSYAEIQTDCEYESVLGRTAVRRDMTLVAKFDDAVVAWGDTYGQAWEELFKHWSPPSGVGELPRGEQYEIEGRRV